MTEGSPRTAMVYFDLHTPIGDDTKPCTHPAHRGFAKAIDADFLPIKPNEYRPLRGTFLKYLLSGHRFNGPKYKTYLLEYSDLLYVAPFIKYRYPDARIICLLTHEIFGSESYNFERDGLTRRVVRRLERSTDNRLKRFLLRRFVDGAIAVSEFSAEYVRNDLGIKSLPIQVANPFIQSSVYHDLEQVTPDLSSKSAVTVCVGREHKGVDILVEAWPTVREHHPDAELKLVGPNHSKTYEAIPGVEILGFVDDLTEVFSSSSVYIHPARVDGFGVSVVEALLAGLPTIITRTTGARSVIADINETLIVEPTVKSLATGVTDYFTLPEKKRAELSIQARRQAASFDADSKLAEFAKAFETVSDQIH